MNRRSKMEVCKKPRVGKWRRREAESDSPASEVQQTQKKREEKKHREGLTKNPRKDEIPIPKLLR